MSPVSMQAIGWPTGPVLCDSHENESIGGWTIDSYPDGFNTYALGQSFTGNGRVLDKVTFKLNRSSNNPAGSFNAAIYAHSGTFGSSSVPTGSALAVSANYTPFTELSTSTVEKDLVFSGGNKITLVNGTKYIVIIELPSTQTFNRYIRAMAGTGHGGNLSTNIGGSWSPQSSYDLWFKVWTD